MVCPIYSFQFEDSTDSLELAGPRLVCLIYSLQFEDPTNPLKSEGPC